MSSRRGHGEGSTYQRESDGKSCCAILPIAVERQTVEQFITQWPDETIVRNRRAKTYRSYEQTAVPQYRTPTGHAASVAAGNGAMAMAAQLFGTTGTTRESEDPARWHERSGRSTNRDAP